MSCILIVWLLFLLAFAAQSLLCWRLGQALNQGVYLRGKGNTSEIEHLCATYAGWSYHGFVR